MRGGNEFPKGLVFHVSLCWCSGTSETEVMAVLVFFFLYFFFWLPVCKGWLVATLKSCQVVFGGRSRKDEAGKIRRFLSGTSLGGCMTVLPPWCPHAVWIAPNLRSICVYLAWHNPPFALCLPSSISLTGSQREALYFFYYIPRLTEKLGETVVAETKRAVKRLAFAALHLWITFLQARNC